jgi:hypothetical protein
MVLSAGLSLPEGIIHPVVRFENQIIQMSLRPRKEKRLNTWGAFYLQNHVSDFMKIRNMFSM